MEKFKADDIVTVKNLTDKDFNTIKAEVGLSTEMRAMAGKTGVAVGVSVDSRGLERVDVMITGDNDTWEWPAWALNLTLRKGEKLEKPEKIEGRLAKPPKFKVGERVAVYAYDGRAEGTLKNYADNDAVEILLSNGNTIVAHEKQLRRLVKKEPVIKWARLDHLQRINPTLGSKNKDIWVKVKVLK